VGEREGGERMEEREGKRERERDFKNRNIQKRETKQRQA
jgi:hypothetical protein